MYMINGVYEIEQPIYKIQENGAESLPDEELLALVSDACRNAMVAMYWQNFASFLRT